MHGSMGGGRNLASVGSVGATLAPPAYPTPRPPPRLAPPLQGLPDACGGTDRQDADSVYPRRASPASLSRRWEPATPVCRRAQATRETCPRLYGPLSVSAG